MLTTLGITMLPEHLSMAAQMPANWKKGPAREKMRK